MARFVNDSSENCVIFKKMIAIYFKVVENKFRAQIEKAGLDFHHLASATIYNSGTYSADYIEAGLNAWLKDQFDEMISDI